MSSQALRPGSAEDVSRPARIAKHKVELQQAQLDLKKCLTHSKDIQLQFFREMSACGESMTQMRSSSKRKSSCVSRCCLRRGYNKQNRETHHHSQLYLDC